MVFMIVLQMYYNCSCIPSSQNEGVTVINGIWNSSQDISQSAVEGPCPQDCDAVKIFVPFVFLMTMGTFVANTAFFTATMR